MDMVSENQLKANLAPYLLKAMMDQPQETFDLLKNIKTLQDDINKKESE